MPGEPEISKNVVKKHIAQGRAGDMLKIIKIAVLAMILLGRLPLSCSSCISKIIKSMVQMEYCGNGCS